MFDDFDDQPTQGTFALDCLPNHTWQGYYGDAHWNGFETPWFDRETTLRLHAALADYAASDYGDGADVDLDWSPETWETSIIDGESHYRVGAGGWVWDEACSQNVLPTHSDAAILTLQAYVMITDSNPDNDLVNLLTDLLHVCDGYDINFNEAVAEAKEQFRHILRQRKAPGNPLGTL